ncbi:MAG: bleomycin resistance protein [Flavobacteriaceae bacterium]|nr:bleomycin resistance protein [Flavobacteriaceae bacterium]
MKALFHLSLPCIGIERTKNFYVNILGATIGRNTQQWIDIDMFGHQITFTKSGDYQFNYKSYKFGNNVLPSFHFGVILEKQIWKDLYTKLVDAKIIFIDTTVFLEEKNGMHSSFFVKDPNGYIVEFKCFEAIETMFLK